MSDPKLEQVHADLWVTEGSIVSFFGAPYPTRCVIARLGDGGLWVWSPVRLTAALRAALDRLGPVQHLVSPNKLHHLFLPDWKIAYPGARLWGPASTIRKCPGLAFQAALEDEPPPEWLGEIGQAWFRGSFAMDEIMFLHRASATFFLVGERARQRPELVAEIRRRGHGIGNHTRTHPSARFWALGPRAMAGEIGLTQAILSAPSIPPPRWFRSVAGHTNPFVAAPLRAHGLARVAWSARGYDAVDGDPVRVLQRIGRDLAPGAIVLLHEGAAHGRSVEIVEATLCLLEERGYATLEPPA